MAARTVKIRHDDETRFYVYRIFDGMQTLYIGKGSGRRLQEQKRRFHADGEILERCRTDDQAFRQEVAWIERLMPTENRNPGGEGGRVHPRRKPRISKEFAEIARVGIHRYIARFLLTKLDERNCDQFGVSLQQLRQIAA